MSKITDSEMRTIKKDAMDSAVEEYELQRGYNDSEELEDIYKSILGAMIENYPEVKRFYEIVSDEDVSF